jgi:hypothetical protein
VTDFSKRVPLARDSDRRQPRSWWDKQILEHASAKPATPLPPKVSDMHLTLQMMQDKSGLRKDGSRWRPAPQNGRPPENARIDPSCVDVPAVYEPAIQLGALEAMRRSLDYAPGHVAEHGFLSSPKRSGGTRATWSIFTSGKPDEIDGDQIKRNMPTDLDLFRYGLEKPDLFTHSHPNYDPPSRPKMRDTEMAKLLNLPVAAIDKGGNIACVVPPGWASRKGSKP